jgi:NAD(P)-dependent dehydrogenase (short-subunit alcohol dehydrogenase family)
MQPRPDHGETSYKGSGKLTGMKAVITGGDSGIGRAVAIAYAREGADILIAFLNETEEANEVKKLVEKEGRVGRGRPARREALPRRDQEGDR